MDRGHTVHGERLRLLGGAALLSVALAVSACQAAAPSSGGGPTPSEAPASVAVGSTSATATTPADRLVAAFGAMSAGYTYDTTVTVGGKTASTATGRWVGGSGEFTLTSGGQTVTYRAIPPKAWVQKPGADWVEVIGGLPSGDPVASLATPQSTQVVSDGSDGLVVDATYPPSALGLTGTAPVRVRVTLAPDGSVTATYSTDTTAGQAVSTTTLKPASGLAPVPTPSPVASGG